MITDYARGPLDHNVGLTRTILSSAVSISNRWKQVWRDVDMR